MVRTARAAIGGTCYHVTNRGNNRAQVFHSDEDYDSFISLMIEANERIEIRILAYCLMPNHFHFALWPREDDHLAKWMHWLTTSHLRRYHKLYRHSGHVWQGRFKAFPIQEDDHLLWVMRYVERNPVRGGLLFLPVIGNGQASRIVESLMLAPFLNQKIGSTTLRNLKQKQNSMPFEKVF